MATKSKEEMVVLLYALYACGRKPSKARATAFVLSNRLLREKPDDDELVSGFDSKIENRLAWARQDLKDNGLLSMPDRGTWAMTEKGFDALKKLAIASLNWKPDLELFEGFTIPRWERFSDEFVRRMKELGTKFNLETQNTTR